MGKPGLGRQGGQRPQGQPPAARSRTETAQHAARAQGTAGIGNHSQRARHRCVEAVPERLNNGRAGVRARSPNSYQLKSTNAVMGATRDNFVKYPRTPHLFGSKGTDDDKHLGQKESDAFIADPSLIVEEKIDGTNVGIHFTSGRRMVLQCRGHEITEGMHPQYDLFKQWTSVKRPILESMLGNQFILYGEWLYAKHSVHYH